MSSLAFIFPGQGSQYVGMGKSLYEKYGFARDMFGRADAVMGYYLSKVCFEGPEEELKKTGNTQPAIFVTSAIVQTILKNNGILPIATAGHSLGEYSALFCADCFTFEQGLRLVIERGRAMNAASEAAKGTMAAVIGLDPSIVEEICGKLSNNGIVKIANINSPTQLVITGDVSAVKAASEEAKKKGAKRVIPLAVHGAFHSPLMEKAADHLREAASGAEIKPPEIAFVNNADAKFLTEPQQIRDSITRQVTSCVRWVEIMEKLVDLGVDEMVEPGPGKVLTGLGRRISKDLKIYPCETPDQIEDVLHLCAN